MLLSLARDLIPPHSSLLRLEYLKGISISLKSSCSTLLKNTSKFGCPVSGFYGNLGQNAGISLKLSEGSRSLNLCQGYESLSRVFYNNLR